MNPDRRDVLRIGALYGAASLSGCSRATESAGEIVDSAESTVESVRPDRNGPETVRENDAVLEESRTAGWPRLGYDAAASSAAADTTAPTDWPVPAWGRVGISERVFPVPPVVVDGTVLRAADTGLAAFDADGTKRWERRLSQPQVPTVVGGTAYVATQRGLLALSIDSGETYWQFYPTGRSGDANELPASATVVDGIVYVSGSNRPLYALDAETGDHQWTYEADGETREGRTKPIRIGSDVFVATESRLHAVDANDGAENWVREFEDAPPFSAVVADPAQNRLYSHLSSSRADGRSAVQAVDVTDGTELWRYAPPDGTRIRTRPALADGTLFFGSESGLHAVDATEATERWSLETAAPVRTTPTVAGDVVYAPIDRDGIGEVAIVRATDGTHRRSAWVGHGPLGQPVVANGRLYAPWRFGITVFEEGGRPDQSTTGSWSGHRGGRFKRAAASEAGLSDPRVSWVSTSASTRDPVLHDGTVYVGNDGIDAIDPATGHRVWRTPLPDADQVATDGERLFCAGVSDAGPIVAATDTDTGDLEWTYELESEARGGPIVEGGTVLVTDEATRVYAISADDGTEIAASDPRRGGFFLAARNEYAFLTDPQGSVYLIHYPTGNKVGEVHADGEYPARGPVLGSDREIYVAQNAGGIYSYGWAEWDGGFERRWRYDPDDPGNNAGDPVLDDDRVYVPYSNGRLYALDREDGSADWQYAFSNDGSGTLAIADGTLYAAVSGYLVAFNAETGDEQWRLELTGETELGVPISETVHPRGVAIGTDGVYVTTERALFKIVND